MANRVIRVCLTSLGCPKNLIDTEVMAASIVKAGLLLCHDAAEADVQLINSCAFIPPAREETMEHIRQAVRWKRQASRRRKIVVTGCFPRWDRSGEGRAAFPEVDLWLGIDTVEKTGSAVGGLFAGDTAAFPIEADPHYLMTENTSRLRLTLPHVAYLKISEGCDNRCAYCSIPAIRGKLRCRSLASVTAEAGALIDDGARELILIAQDTSAFGRDTGSSERLPELLRALDRLDGDFHIRVLYLHPAGIDDALIAAFAECPKVLPYADVPLQHIADGVLKAMNRKLSAEATVARLEAFRKRVPGLALRTTFMVGFPGESEADFECLRQFVKAFRFERLGVFRYYPEPGTPAAALPNAVSPEIGEERRRLIAAAHEENSLALNKSLEGRRFDVIIDFPRGRDYIGRTYRDAPDIDNTVSIRSRRRHQSGDSVRIKVTGSTAFELKATTDLT